MPLPTYYNTGTATVANGATLITFTDAFLGSAEFPTIMPGDLFMDPAQPEIPPQRIASVDYDAVPQTATLAFDWPGSGLTADPYEIRLVGAIERSTAQTRRYLELLGQLGFTGISINAFGDFTDRDLYDSQVQGYTFLSLDGDGTPGSPPLIYIKQSSADGDWSSGISFQGGQGPQGESSTWLSGSGVPSNALGEDGDMYLNTANGDVYGPKAAGAWGAAVSNTTGPMGATGSPGIDGTSMLTRVRVVSEVDEDLSTLANGDTIDGEVIATNWIVLLSGQTAPEENGVYLIGASAGTTARLPAFDSFDELPGVYFSIMQGTVNADTLWKCTSDLGGTIDVDPLEFILFASSEGFMARSYQAYAAGSGVSYTLPIAPSSNNSLDVYVGSILQPKDGVAYTYSGTTLTLSEDPGADDIVEVYVFDSLPMGSVPAGSVGTAELNAAQAAGMRGVLDVPSVAEIREKLTANRTYYVRTDGSDSNNGLANTAGGAFLTLQKAMDVVATLDIAIYNVTIQVGSGTYTAGVLLKSPSGSGQVILQGDTGTPANVVVNVTNDNCFNGVNQTGRFLIKGFKCQTTTTGSAIRSIQTYIEFESMDFGACATAHLWCEYNGAIVATGNYSITGGSTRHLFATNGGIVTVTGKTVTLTGTPAFSTAFAIASRASGMVLSGNTWSGSATGIRFIVSYNANIDVAGAGDFYFPGSVAGQRVSGGIYDTAAREIITANRTYYVRTDGSDNNTGLADTAGGAFLTIAKALSVAAALDCSIYNVTVQVGAGTWAVSVQLPAMLGSGVFTLRGDPTTPANVIISATSSNAISGSNAGAWTVNGFKLQTTTSGNLMTAYFRTTITFLNIDFGSCAGAHQVSCEAGASVIASGPCTISGQSTFAFMTAAFAGYMQMYATTFTVVGNKTYTYFAYAPGGVINSGSMTFTLSGGAVVTATRYRAEMNGVINTSGGGANYFPGTVAGTLATGGQYI